MKLILMTEQVFLMCVQCSMSCNSGRIESLLKSKIKPFAKDQMISYVLISKTCEPAATPERNYTLALILNVR